MADVQIRFQARSSDARREIAHLKREVEGLRQGLGQTQRTSTEAAVGVDTLGDAARDSARDIGGLADQLTKTAEAGQSVKVLTGTLLTATQALDVLTPTLQQSALAVGGSAGLTGLMRSAAAEAVGLRGEIEALEEPFTQFNISLADASKEQQHLTQYSRELIHELNVLERSSRPFEVLHTDINLVNPAISDAAENMRLYIRVMDAVQDEFQEIDTLSERLTTSIRNQASAFDELRTSVGGVSAAASGLPGQQLGSGVFDQFDARTPGSNFGASFGDNIAPVAAQLGQELASQAIRTAGELRRIEQDRIEDLQDLERAYSETIIAINERKRERLASVEQQIADERLRRIASIETVFEDAAAAEVEARQEAADRIEQIEVRAAAQRTQLRERLNERLIDLEQRRDDRIQDLTDGFIEREQDRQQQILQITERATEARAAAAQQYADRVQAINNRLVEDVRAVQARLASDLETLQSGLAEREAERAAEIVQITQDAADARAAANQSYLSTMQGIYNDLVAAWDALEEGFTERTRDRAEERIEIEERAAQGRIDAYEAYNQTVARISTDLVDEIREIQDEITEVIADAAEERTAIEQEAIDARAGATAEYAREIEDIEAERVREIEDINGRIREIQDAAADARLEADRDYADRFQGIQNDLVDRVVDIQQDLNDRVVDIQRDLNETLNDLRDEQLDAEQDRLDSLVELHEDANARLEDLERDRTRTIEDLREEFQRDQFDAAVRLDRERADAEDDEDRENANTRYYRRIQDLTRDFHRDVQDLYKAQARAREDLARRTAAREVEIAERAASRQAEIAQQHVDVRAAAQANIGAAESQAREGISAAASQAGVSFEEAQANYVPALSAHEAALRTHAAALEAIAAQETADTETATAEQARVLQESFEATAQAGLTLSETLTAINEAERERLGTLGTETTTTVGGLSDRITDAEGRAGLSFQEALRNYTPAVDLNTQAIQTLNETLAGIDSEVSAGLAGLAAAGALDRETTTAAQRALETNAGVSIDEARVNYVPALSSAARATLTLNETMRELDASFQATVAAIQSEGWIDRQATELAIATAVENALQQTAALETQAGTTFAEASAAFQPGLSDIAQAGVDRDTTLSGIDAAETAAFREIDAQSIADRLQTDAEITAARDEYIKVRDTAIFQHNTAILALNTQEAADIKSVRATLDKNLTAIDEKLDMELAEIREAKVVFDTRIGELIDSINEEANTDVAALNRDTAAMRDHLEELAAEARDNQWKSAILSMASAGIQIAGVAAGAAIGGPAGAQAGGQIGGIVGGLVQDAGNAALFHYERTDAIARSVARSESLRRRREHPNFFPSADQIRNARDISREIVAGINEAQRQGGGGIGNTPTFRVNIEPADVVINEDVIAQVLDQALVRIDQDGRSVGSYQRGDT